MNILLLNAYAARSHVQWQERLLAMFSHWQWRVLSLPPRHFSWRVRGNPLYWSLTQRETLEREYDLVIATSMVDLATLRGLVPALASVPTVLYFHENQFAYPGSEHQSSLLEAQMVSLYSSLAADQVLFNSRYNRDSFLAGVEALLKRLPDKVPEGIPVTLSAKSRVLPVPLEMPGGRNASASECWPGAGGFYPDRPLRLLWVGRFEHDKGGEGLLLMLRQLEVTGLKYELAVVGQQFRNSPAAFNAVETEFDHRLVQYGYVDSYDDYRQLLAAGDIVLSTATHEFQGLAVLEAVAAGCIPAVPERLVYPEIFQPAFCYPSTPANPDEEASAASAVILSHASLLRAREIEAPDVTAYGEEALRPKYQAVFADLAASMHTQT